MYKQLIIFHLLQADGTALPLIRHPAHLRIPASILHLSPIISLAVGLQQQTSEMQKHQLKIKKNLI